MLFYKELLTINSVIDANKFESIQNLHQTYDHRQYAFINAKKEQIKDDSIKDNSIKDNSIIDTIVDYFNDIKNTILGSTNDQNTCDKNVQINSTTNRKINSKKNRKCSNDIIIINNFLKRINDASTKIYKCIIANELFSFIENNFQILNYDKFYNVLINKIFEMKSDVEIRELQQISRIISKFKECTKK